MTIQVKIEHCNETIPTYLMVQVLDQDGGNVLQELPIGPGLCRHFTLHDAQVLKIMEMSVEQRADLCH